MRINAIEFGRSIRKNLGNYEHEDRSAKVSGALDDGEDVGAAVAYLHSTVAAILAGKVPGGQVAVSTDAPADPSPAPAADMRGTPAAEAEQKRGRGRPPKAKDEPAPAPVETKPEPDPVADLAPVETKPEPAPAADEDPFGVGEPAAAAEVTDDALRAASSAFANAKPENITKARKFLQENFTTTRVLELNQEQRAKFMAFLAANQ